MKSIQEIDLVRAKQSNVTIFSQKVGVLHNVSRVVTVDGTQGVRDHNDGALIAIPTHLSNGKFVWEDRDTGMDREVTENEEFVSIVLWGDWKGRTRRAFARLTPEQLTAVRSGIDIFAHSQ